MSSQARPGRWRIRPHRLRRQRPRRRTMPASAELWLLWRGLVGLALLRRHLGRLDCVLASQDHVGRLCGLLRPLQHAHVGHRAVVLLLGHLRLEGRHPLLLALLGRPLAVELPRELPEGLLLRHLAAVLVEVVELHALLRLAALLVVVQPRALRVEHPPRRLLLLAQHVARPRHLQRRRQPRRHLAVVQPFELLILVVVVVVEQLVAVSVRVGAELCEDARLLVL
mmetsp:Transcript_2197/g.7443  ORF Transcript_2197/g.7443 Transcript_2197/m.7443 type:complete len:225 (-) Transcript_2197:1972-2646(-)